MSWFCKYNNREISHLSSCGTDVACDCTEELRLRKVALTPAPNPPPRGGAEPRVSDGELASAISRHELSADSRGSPNSNYFYDLRDARAEIADLRAKLEDEQGAGQIWCKEAYRAQKEAKEQRARADAAEAALREMTEQRDGAWEAGALAMRDAAVKCARDLRHPDFSAESEDWCEGASAVADALAGLAPPAETAAKEERT